jgi:hypothetical protein
MHPCSRPALAPRTQLLPPAAKLETVRAAQSQFGAVREKILDAAAVTCADTETPCADEQTGLLTSLIADGACDAAPDGAAMEEQEQDAADGDAAATSDPKAAAPAGARDFDREGSTTFELGRRLRVRRIRCALVCLFVLPSSSALARPSHAF